MLCGVLYHSLAVAAVSLLADGSLQVGIFVGSNLVASYCVTCKQNRAMHPSVDRMRPNPFVVELEEESGRKLFTRRQANK